MAKSLRLMSGIRTLKSCRFDLVTGGNGSGASHGDVQSDLIAMTPASSI